MHAFFHMAHAKARRRRLGCGRFRAISEQLWRSATASKRYAMLKSLGLTRASVCLRVFVEFYSMANVEQRRG